MRDIPITIGYTKVLKINDIRKYCVNYIYMLYNMFFMKQWFKPQTRRGREKPHG